MRHTLHFSAAPMWITVTIFSLLALTNNVIVAEPRPADCTGICDLTWSPAEQYLLGAVDAFGLWLYEANESESAPLFFPNEYSMSLSFDPQGQYVAVTSCPGFTVFTDPCKGSLSLFDLKERSWKQLGTYNYPIDNVKFSPDGRFIAFQKDEIGAWGIQLIDLTNNEAFSIVDRNHTNIVIDYAFDAQSGHIAISNGLYGYEGHQLWGISVWSLSAQTLQAFTEGSMYVADVAFAETDTDVLFVEYDTQVSTWNSLSGTILPLRQMTEIMPDNLNRLSFSHPPTHLMGALLEDWHPADRQLYIWDIQSGEQVFFKDMPEDGFMDLITVNRTGEYVAYASTVVDTKLVSIWDQATGSVRQISMAQ